MNASHPTIIAALDRLDRASDCWIAFNDLLNPSHTLNEVDRDKLSVLSGFLVDEYKEARKQLSEALAKG